MLPPKPPSALLFAYRISHVRAPALVGHVTKNPISVDILPSFHRLTT